MPSTTRMGMTTRRRPPDGGATTPGPFGGAAMSGLYAVAMVVVDDAREDLAKLSDGAFGACQRDAAGLICGHCIDQQVACAVQRDGSGDHIGVAGDAGPEPVARLRELLLGETKTLTRRVHLLP